MMMYENNCIYCTYAENAQSFRAEMNRHEQYEGLRHAPSNILQMKSKLVGFDKLGAWPTHLNFQPWQQTPVPLGLVVYKQKNELKGD